MAGEFEPESTRARLAQHDQNHWIAQERLAREARIGMIQGTAEMLRAPGKMFSRETIIAVLRGQKAALDHGPATEDPIIAAQHRALAESIRIFENLEWP